MTLLFDPTTHTYTYNGQRMISVTEAIKAVGLIDDRWFTEEATWRGSVVHRVCELDDLGTLDEDSVDPAAQGYLEAWRAAKSNLDLRFSDIEKPKVNGNYGFAGTPDRIGLSRTKKVVIDLKTGAEAPWHGLQLAAYAAFDHPFAATYHRFTIRLQPDGKYSLTKYEDYWGDWAAFHGALAVAKWRLKYAA